MIVRLPRAAARACKPSGRSAYRMVIMPAPVRMPPAPASLPQMNTEGDDIITDDHIMRGETAAGPPPGAGGPPPWAAGPPPAGRHRGPATWLGARRRGYAQGCRSRRTAGGRVITLT